MITYNIFQYKCQKIHKHTGLPIHLLPYFDIFHYESKYQGSLTTSFPEIVLTLSNGINPSGGVYNNPAAAIYWEERFGDLFSGGLGELREIQSQVD